MNGLGAAAAVCVAVLLVGACSRDNGPGAELRSVLDSASAPARFAFDYRAGGTRVNDCFLPNRSFAGLVDRDTGVLALRRADDGEPSAYVAGDGIYLRSTLFATGVTEASWLQARGPLDAAYRGAVVDAVGDGLAGYVASGLLPPDGSETALALVDVARAVRRTAVADDGATYELDVPGDELADGTEAPGAEPPDVLAEVTVAGGRVTRISIGEAAEPGQQDADDEDEGPLWAIEYRRSNQRVELPALEAVEDLVRLDPGRLEPPAITRCEVPL